MTALSKSALWSKMQEYYHNIGPQAWQDELVPLQISSNKNLALAYANIIVAQIIDWNSANPKQSTTEPFYIVEIGAGHGKFGFYILKYLEQLLANFNLPLSTIKFIMTDIAIKNIESWQAHPALQPWVECGALDFAQFNAMSDQEINLIAAQSSLKAGSMQKPIFMLCNYLFDSLAHDAFHVKDNKLFEAQIKIDSDADWEQYFAKAKFTFKYAPIDANYYADPILNKILAYYAQNITNGSFMLPVGGIDCINTLRKFSQAPLVLLIADKGQAHIDLFDDLDDPDISVHGSISLMVNFDALARYFNFDNGISLLMPNQSVDFQVACFSTATTTPIPHTKNAFYLAMSGASPQDIVNLCYIDDEINPNFKNLDQLLAMLNLTLWDPNTFYDFHEQMLDYIEAEDINVEQEKALLAGIALAWDYFFKLELTQDLPFAVGSIYYALDEFEKAIEFYKLSIQEFGPNAENLYNLAITYQAMDEDGQAKQFAQETLKVDPKYQPAKELLAELA